MSWLNGPWRAVARLTHLSAKAQQRLWRVLILICALFMLAGWAALSALTRAAEKNCEQTGQIYVAVAPLAAEVMDLRDRKGQMEGAPPLLAAERVARGLGIGAERLRISPTAGSAAGPGARPANAPTAGQPASLDAGATISLRAQGLDLRELVEVLRDLRVEAGLRTLSAHMTPSVGNDNRMDLDLVLSR